MEPVNIILVLMSKIIIKLHFDLKTNFLPKLYLWACTGLFRTLSKA